MSTHNSMNTTGEEPSSSKAEEEPKELSSLPAKRFELELEFVQALASPAYLHFLATQRSEETGGPLLQDPAFQEFLRYLRQTWSQPEYARFLQYPHCLYFLDLLIETPAVLQEWTQTAFRDFCHQQQFLAWQHRHATCYGVSKQKKDADKKDDNNDAAATTPTTTADVKMEDA